MRAPATSLVQAVSAVWRARLRSHSSGQLEGQLAVGVDHGGQGGELVGQAAHGEGPARRARSGATSVNWLVPVMRYSPPGVSPVSHDRPVRVQRMLA